MTRSTAVMLWVKRTWHGLAAMICAGCFVGCGGPRSSDPPRSAPLPSLVPVSGISSDSIVDEGFLAVVLADSAVNVAAQVEGRLESIPVRLGDVVERHQTLAVIRAERPKQAVAEARAALDEARSQLRRAELESTEADERYQRQRRLGDLSSQESVRQSELDHQVAESAVEAGRARVAQLESRLAQGQWRVEQHTVRAPFAGEVAARYAEPGAWITSGMPLARVVSVDTLRLRFAVPADRVDEIKVGRSVSFKAKDWQESLAGEVRHIAPEIEPASQMVFVEASLGQTGATIRPGEVGRVHLLAEMTPQSGLTLRTGSD